ncbi:MAG: hypothetical protein NUW00_04170 [Candidatus Kaiserbacteria bacterium]|nr:hypothetical protein [Candidatus Kaiserbacteria bacterium]
MTLVRIMRRELHKFGARRTTPHHALGDVWIAVFERIFGEKPKGHSDQRWDVLISSFNGSLNGLKVMRRARHSL